MPKTLARTLWTFVLMVFAVLSWHWLDNNNPIDPANIDELQMAADQTDYYLEDFRIVNVDSASGKTYQLSGNSLAHSRARGDSVIQQPRIKVFSKDTTDTWQGSAKVATVSEDFSVLGLSGSVGMLRNSDSMPVTLETESLIIDINQDVMETTNPVQFTSSNWSITAKQMQADVNSGKLTFVQGVEVKYEAN